jgi:response regulator RpfG family c-di-GMP phosphodiesterase
MSHTVLLVDDEENILNALKRELHSEGYHLLTANSGTAALKILEQEKIHLVVADHRMPGIFGIDLLKQVQASYPDIVRFLLTGASDLDDVLTAVKCGVAHKYLCKPCDRQLLKVTLWTSLVLYDQKRIKDQTWK